MSYASARRNVDLEIDHMMRRYLEDTYDVRLKEAANMPEGRVHNPAVHPDDTERGGRKGLA